MIGGQITCVGRVLNSGETLHGLVNIIYFVVFVLQYKI